MASLENPTELSLGRVSTSATAVRHTAPPPPMPKQDTSVVDGLLSIGQDIAGRMIKEQKTKQFYAGQDRILQATLEGTQQEELETILTEQPWYMQVMGPGATAQGAVEMASRVGAGRIFNDGISRLASGQDADIDPDTYREQVMAQIQSKRSGNAQVDAVFMPQLITKGQGLIATHLTKHLELNAQNAMTATVTETDDAIKTMSASIQHEYGATATFQEGMPRELMSASIRYSYDNLVNTLNPQTRPTELTEGGWLKGKFATAEAAIARGDTAVYQAVHESGMYERLDAPSRVALDKARATGKADNDSHKQLQFVGMEAELTTAIFRAKTVNDVAAVFQQAQDIAAAYDTAGITRPDAFKNDAAIKAHVTKALGEKNSYEEKMDNRMHTELMARRKEAADLAKIQYERALAVDQVNAMNTGLLVNALGNNPTAPLFIHTEDGIVLHQPTDTERMSAYTQYKGMLLQLPPEERAAQLQKKGVASMEELAYRFQLVDPNTRGVITQHLRASLGKPLLDANSSAAIDKVLALGSTGDEEYVKDHVGDDVLKKNLVLFQNNYKLTGDKQGAWERSFGREQGVTIAINETKFKDAAASGDVKSYVKAAGRMGPQVQALINAEARASLEDGAARDTGEAFVIALERVQSHTEVTKNGVMRSVPRESRLDARTGIRNPVTLDNAVEYYVRQQLPKGVRQFDIEYNPGADQHLVIPKDSDGRPRFNAAFPLDYSAVSNVINGDKFRENELADAVIKAEQEQFIPAIYR